MAGSKGVLRIQMMEAVVALQQLVQAAGPDGGPPSMLNACQHAIDEIELRLLEKLEHALEARGLLEKAEE